MTSRLSREHPPSQATAEEAVQRQLHLARAQGDAYEDAVRYVAVSDAVDAAETRAGELWVGYAVQPARGVHEWEDGALVWREPRDGEVHLLVTIRDVADGRFVPGATVTVTLTGPDGVDVGTAIQRLVWDPVFYHYGAAWPRMAHGPHHLRVRVEPPTFPRSGFVDGRRFAEAVEVEFSDVILDESS